jgi:hypothetical protein
MWHILIWVHKWLSQVMIDSQNMGCKSSEIHLQCCRWLMCADHSGNYKHTHTHTHIYIYTPAHTHVLQCSINWNLAHEVKWLLFYAPKPQIFLHVSVSYVRKWNLKLFMQTEMEFYQFYSKKARFSNDENSERSICQLCSQTWSDT